MNVAAVLSVAILLTVATSPFARAAEIKGLITPAMRAALETLKPQFERQSGHTLNITFVPAGSVAKRMQEMGGADLVITARPAVEALAKDGKVAAESIANIGKSGVFLAVRAGAPKPDIATPEALKRTLLAARAISFSNPVAGGASGVHLLTVLEKLGIAEEMKPKTRHPAIAQPTAELVVSGEADIAIQQFPELAAVKGVEIVGPLPGEFQNYTVFAGSLTTNAASADAARAFLQFLKSDAAVAEIKKSGLEPG